MAAISETYWSFVIGIFFLITCLSEGTTPGHYSIEHGKSIKILRKDLMTALEAGNPLPTWTFDTAVNSRIMFSFQEFSYYNERDNNHEVLDIGDGLNTGSSTRLATFGGRDLPSNVTSVSSAAWLKASKLWFWRFQGGYTDFELSMTISAIPVEDTIRTFMDGNALTIEYSHSSNNRYHLWDFRAPDGFIISILFEEFQIVSPWDEKTFLSFGENAHNFSEGEDISCSAWTKLNDDKGQFNSNYKTFPSRGSSAQFIFSSFSTEASFSIKLSYILPQDIRQIPVHHRSNISITPNDFVKTISCSEDCFTWRLLTVNASNDLRVRISFLAFNLSEFEEYFDIGDGLVMDDDTRLVRFSGETMPSNVTSISSAAWIKIYSACGNKSPRFKITLTGINISELIFVQKEEELRSSPNFPHQYPKNGYILWNIEAPNGFLISINIDQFDIQKGTDFVHIGDGVQEFHVNSTRWRQFTGHIRDLWDRRSFSSTTQFVTVIFTSGGGSAGVGFTIKCSFLNINGWEKSVGSTSDANPVYSSQDDIETTTIAIMDVSSTTLPFLLMVIVSSSLSVIFLVTNILGWMHFRSRREKNASAATNVLAPLPSPPEDDKSSVDSYEYIQDMHQHVDRHISTDNIYHELNELTFNMAEQQEATYSTDATVHATKAKFFTEHTSSSTAPFDHKYEYTAAEVISRRSNLHSPLNAGDGYLVMEGDVSHNKVSNNDNTTDDSRVMYEDVEKLQATKSTDEKAEASPTSSTDSRELEQTYFFSYDFPPGKKRYSQKEDEDIEKKSSIKATKPDHLSTEDRSEEKDGLELDECGYLVLE